MNTSASLRAAADNCRRLSRNTESPVDARKLATLATEFDDLAYAVEAAEFSPDADGMRRNG